MSTRSVATLTTGVLLGALLYAALSPMMEAPQAVERAGTPPPAPPAPTVPEPPPAPEPESPAPAPSEPPPVVEAAVKDPASREPSAPSAPAAVAQAGPQRPPDLEEAIGKFKDLVEERREKGDAFSLGGRSVGLAREFRTLGNDGIPFLREMLGDRTSGDDRFLAAAILRWLEDPLLIQAIPELETAALDPDVEVARHAAAALSNIRSREAVLSLERCLNQSPDQQVQRSCAYRLAKLGEKSGRDYMIAAYRRKEAGVVFAMADVDAPEFAAEVRPLIADRSADTFTRCAAIGCAGNAKDRDAVPILEQVIAAPETSDWIRETAKKAMKRIRGE